MFRQDEPGDFSFLRITHFNGEDATILGFLAHGKNTSADSISDFSGYIRSDLTNAQRQILLLAQEPITDHKAPSNALWPSYPTAPDQTYGIPGLADFEIDTYDKIIPMPSDGETLSQFARDFGPFTLVLKYDGKTIERHFSLDQIKNQLALFAEDMNPQSRSIPRVTRKPTAATPAQIEIPLAPFVRPDGSPNFKNVP